MTPRRGATRATSEERSARGVTRHLLIGRFFRPWNPWEFKRRLNLALVHYSYVRPHASLDGMTPIEVYYGIRGHLPRPVAPPRGRTDDPGPEIPFEFVFLDPDRRALPVLVPKAA